MNFLFQWLFRFYNSPFFKIIHRGNLFLAKKAENKLGIGLVYIFDNSSGIEYSGMIFKNKKKIEALEKLIEK